MTIEVDYSGDCSDSRVHYMEGSCGHAIAIRTGCNKRFDYFCPSCAKKWRMKTQRRYEAAVRHFQTPKFMTLTLTKRRSLIENISRIWDMRKALFRRLRAEGYVIRGWCGVVELPNHVHLIVDCDFIPQWEISKIWKTITGDSYVVDIRAVKRGRDGDTASYLRYLTKYITKASEWDGINLDFFEGFHIINSNGLVKEEKRLLPCPCCGHLGHWTRILEEKFFACRFDDLEAG